jgi:hypothetical protein
VVAHHLLGHLVDDGSMRTQELLPEHRLLLQSCDNNAQPLCIIDAVDTPSGSPILRGSRITLGSHRRTLLSYGEPIVDRRSPE